MDVRQYIITKPYRVTDLKKCLKKDLVALYESMFSVKVPEGSKITNSQLITALRTETIHVDIEKAPPSKVDIVVKKINSLFKELSVSEKQEVISVLAD